jgi:hypothetical protein
MKGDHRRLEAWARVSIAAFVGVATLLIGGASLVAANPQGVRGDEIGKLLFKFNLIVTPKEWSANDTQCPNNGARIFFKQQTGKLGTITWVFDPTVNGFDITDCDGTTDQTARVLQDEGIPVWIVVRLLGPANSQVELVCAEIATPPFAGDVGLDDLCVVTSKDLQKTKQFVTVGTNLVDGALEGLTFTLNTINGFPVKILQFRVYERLFP